MVVVLENRRTSATSNAGTTVSAAAELRGSWEQAQEKRAEE